MVLLEWWNFLFVAPLLAGVVLAVVLVLTGLGEHGGGEHQVGDAAHDGVDHDTGDAGEHSLDLLGWFGIGRGVSLSVMLPVLLVTWGLSGLVLNAALQTILRTPVLFAPLAALGAVLGMALVGRSFAAAFVRLTDTNRITSIHTGGLVGCTGTSVYEISTQGGSANIRDPFGNIHRVGVRSSSQGVIPPNAAITVLEFHGGVYIVQASDRVDSAGLTAPPQVE
jgi:Protein of unknown function (DUF1449)